MLKSLGGAWEESLVDLLTRKLDEVTRGTGGLFRNAASCYTQFLKRPWQSLRPWIEQETKCTSGFLRAFYDGEGSISGRSLILYNTRSDILLYIRVLLSKLNIETTELHFGTKAGTELVDPLNGKTYIRNSDCFTLRIRARSLPQFARGVGFMIARKQQMLGEALPKIG